MTLALCFACGEKKFGCFNPCESCGREPVGPDELATAFLLSDHFYSEEQLKGYSTRIKGGLPIAAPNRFRDEVMDAFPGQLEANRPRPKRRRYGTSRAWWAPSLVWSLFTKRRRRQLSLATLERLRAGERVDFCLYLRPFRFDSRSFYKASERRLTWLVEQRMPLLSLAGKKSSLGAARIATSDEQWREDFLMLARNAVAIFTQDPRDPLGQLTYMIDEFEGLAYEFQTLAELRFTSKAVFLSKGGEFALQGADVPDHWAVPSKWNFCEIIGSGIGLRPLTARSIREVFETVADCRGIEPPMRDRFVHGLCEAFADPYLAPGTQKVREERKESMRRMFEYEKSPEARARRRKQRLQLLLTVVISTALVLLMNVCLDRR